MARHRAKGRRDSSKCLIVGRTVNFNLEDPHQRWMYEATCDWTNFSGRMKRLIEAEISGVPVRVITDPQRSQSAMPHKLEVVKSEVAKNQVSIFNEPDFDPIAQLFGR